MAWGAKGSTARDRYPPADPVLPPAAQLAALRTRYRIVETTDQALLARLATLPCIFNVESNLWRREPRRVPAQPELDRRHPAAQGAGRAATRDRTGKQPRGCRP
jgi:hypothetical protein